MLEHGVRVRAAAGLHVRHVSWIVEVADVEDTQAAQAVLAHRILNTAAAAIEAAAEALTGNEEQIPIDRDVALGSGAEERLPQGRRRGIRDVPEHEAVVVALNRVIAEEREVRVRAARELIGRWRRRNEPH